MSFAAWLGRRARPALAKALPPLSETERLALEAGSVGFEGQLFAGRPDFSALGRTPALALSEREKSFLDGPVRRLCRMLDDHAIDEAGDLPEEVWRWMREQRFFGMIIPERHGGLGFSHQAHATVVARIATVNVAAAVTVMVPNSLGPAELLLHYGTPEQQAHWLPRLANGSELPCFGLTSPYAGSDAASIPDRGVLVEREFEGRMTRGFLVDFDKRYITLAPVATVVGLAFQAHDPSRPEGEQDLGITCALIPVPQPGLQIGRRHRPMASAFMNGPIRGRQVFVPLDWVIGGEAQVGQGWRMLMECLAAGRAISLPALGSAMQQSALFVTQGYGRIREQFGLPIGRFHAVAGITARMAAELYATDAARRYTAVVLDAGERPSVAGAMLKVQLTEAGRRAVNHGMDILGGKGIIAGPANLLGTSYRQAPIAITVEGANLLTRALIVFGQGAVRCHPYVLDEMAAVHSGDDEALGRALLRHVAHVMRNFGRSLVGGGVQGSVPDGLLRQGRAIQRLSARLAFAADLAMGLLGGKLKRMELLSARLGDVLAHLYLASASVWRFKVEDGEEPLMLPLARASINAQLHAGELALQGFYANMPQGGVRLLGRLMTGKARPEAETDECWLDIAQMLEHEPMLLSRLLPDLQRPATGGMLDLMEALELAQRLGPEAQTLQKAWRKTRSVSAASQGAADPALARAYLQAVDRVIQVDDGPGPNDAPSASLKRPAEASAPAGPGPSANPPERRTPRPVPAK